jgi:hypothetical protein
MGYIYINKKETIYITKLFKNSSIKPAFHKTNTIGDHPL